MSEPVTMSSRGLYFRLLSHVKPYWRQFGGAILATVILALTEPAIPMLLKPLLDGTFVDKDPDYMFWTPIALVVLFLIRGVMGFCSSVAFEWVSGKLVYDLRRLMFERILSFPTAYFDANATGNIVNKATFNVNQVTTAATRVLVILVKDSIAIIGLIAWMLYLDWQLTMTVFILIPVIALMVKVLAVRLRRISRKLQATMGEMTHALEEGARGHKVIKVFGGQQAEKRRFNKMANWVRRYNLKAKVAGSANVPVVEAVGALMLTILIASAEDMTVGAFVSFLTAMGLLFPPIKRLTGINHPLQRGLAAAESVFGLIDEPAEQDSGSRQIERATGRLEFNAVTFRYEQTGKDALSNISFTVEPGTTVALVGPSGGGKTTIASLIPRFYNPSQGQILLDGIDIQELRLTNLRDNLSYVGQNPTLFNDTIRANIAFGQKQEPGQQELEAIAKSAHALEFIQGLPEGFDTFVGEDGVRLSGGQRQRIAIARALLKNAPVLILDEATSALDTESERHVQAALHSLTANRTTLVIAHRLSTIEHADLILVVKEGQIIEQGKHAELLAIGGEYTKLYRNQFQPDDNGQHDQLIPDSNP
ncbi:MAG: lipid A export permease/ATP-binding protein MsbA [Candidatus Polarisedimenticolaceae bacterium]|nr:lipid A export permease/ATP-binding protein MsbA [Candidatus Polarisedimenticolaceae bacterium]